MNSADTHNLARFIGAQQRIYEKALAEIRNGYKQTHWMWFIFPQIDGLAESFTSEIYAIKSLDEANAYLAHPILGFRLIECTDAVLGIEGKTASDIFWHPDDMKLKSCMTLFACVSAEASIFKRVLDKYYQGQTDEKTLQMLRCIGGG